MTRHFQLSCTLCLYTHTFFTTIQIDLPERNKGRQKRYDVNVRAIYGCRQVGVGHGNFKKLCCYLNMAEPMLSNNYNNISLKLKESAKRFAEKSRSTAASKLRGAADTTDVGVSVAGTWQYKGFISLNGVITAISTDSRRILDTAILSKRFKVCTKMRTIKTIDLHD